MLLDFTDVVPFTEALEILSSVCLALGVAVLAVQPCGVGSAPRISGRRVTSTLGWSAEQVAGRNPSRAGGGSNEAQRVGAAGFEPANLCVPNAAL